MDCTLEQRSVSAETVASDFRENGVRPEFGQNWYNDREILSRTRD